MNDKVYLFRVNAVAGDGASYGAGARHAHLVFVSGSSLEAAEPTAVAALQEAGWHSIEVLRGGELGPDGHEGADDVLRSAAGHAMINGSAIVTYATPIPSEA